MAAPLTLLLLHGLGATHEVWDPMIEASSARWNGPIHAPDLRGHGGAPWRDGYRLGDFAEDLGSFIGEGDYVVLGHSMGGAVALALASGRYGGAPQHALGLGVKVEWTDEERTGLAKRAAGPPRRFASREEAVDRYLKSAGLAGLIGPESHLARAGVREDAEGWRLACDPRTGEVGPPPMDALCSKAQAPFALACGQHDPMVDVDQLRRWDANARALAGLGHNAMVEDPQAVWRWLRATIAR
jgi:pimeloyl-ACP methyl ester carboxylesterase